MNKDSIPSSPLARRDFLKLAGAFCLVSLGGLTPSVLPGKLPAAGNRPNIILIIFDALSALHLSLYGYPRKTTPNLERLAQRSMVYHAHHSAANFTTPSTASLFTGTYPWTHRAFSLGGLVKPEMREKNIYQWLGKSYYQLAFAQNLYVDVLLYQARENLERHLGVNSFSLSGRTFYNSLFPKDAINGLKSYDQFLFEREETHGSLFLSLLNDLEQQLSSRAAAEKMAERYPEGLPRVANSDVYFSLEQVIQGAGDLLRSAVAPFFAYFHFLPPHAPYLPSRDFMGMFDDGWSPPAKKKHRLSAGSAQKRLVELRQTYDEFIANLDAEFGKLLDTLENTGLLDNSYLIFTSDHGELFERGEHGHTTALMFEPILRIPLLISTPGQHTRQDISALTTNVDLLPTLSKIAGLDVPNWCEGQVLPGMGGPRLAERSIFAVEAKKNPAHSPLEKASLALIRGKYKLVRYLGYRNVEGYEFYDLENDPEELDNGYDSHPAAKELQVELDAKLQQVNQPYLGKG